MGGQLLETLHNQKIPAGITERGFSVLMGVCYRTGYFNN
jgi:hypothetical protein